MKWHARPLLVIICVSTLATSPAAASELPELTGDEFNDLFTTAPLENLASIDPAPVITGNSSVDARIRQIGEERGYVRRPTPAGPLVNVGGVQLQPDAAEAWAALRDAARAAGHTLVLQSGYRSHSTQRTILLRRLYSYTYSAINYRLQYVAPPGYSKHHTGYAIDITQPGYAFTSFAASPAYAWLAGNNYANAKRHGWIPSYPPDATNQGPRPEAWEFTYVGIDNIRCYGFSPTEGDNFCDDQNSVFTADIEWLLAAGITSGCNPPRRDRFCPTDPVTRGQFAAFLHRALRDRLPVTGNPVSFTDTAGSTFAADIAWLSATGITTGCAADAFCPETLLTRGQLAAFLTRAFAYEEGAGADIFSDDDESIFADQIDALATAGITRGCNPPDNDRFCPAAEVTRGQIAAFLHRALTPGGTS